LWHEGTRQILPAIVVRRTYSDHCRSPA
jgi:hypothetical protein